MNKSNTGMRHPRLLATLALGLAAQASIATPVSVTLPGSTFGYNVMASGVSQCASGRLTSDGICDYTSANLAAGGTAQASGGIPGTPGYDGLPGTGVSASATNGQVSVAGPGTPVRTESSMDYFFVVNGPGDQIPITVLSAGLASLTGAGSALATFTIADSGSDAGITAASDPDPEGYLYEKVVGVRSSDSSFGPEQRSWNESVTLCVVPGDVYEVRIDAIAYSTGQTGQALASIDPQLKVDPPAPQSCELDGPLSAYSLGISDNASAGFDVPEPGTLVLAGLGLGLLGLVRLRSGRRR